MLLLLFSTFFFLLLFILLFQGIIWLELHDVETNLDVLVQMLSLLLLSLLCDLHFLNFGTKNLKSM